MLPQPTTLASSADIREVTRLKRRHASRYDGNKHSLHCFGSHSPEKISSRNGTYTAKFSQVFKCIDIFGSSRDSVFFGTR
jgi:hypothetical protein